MKTPIADFIDRYIEKKTVRFHMPGHKGSGNIEKYDITEICGADVLYSPDGIIAKSENNATALFETAHTFYSTEGSTLAIKAMLAIATLDARKEGRMPKILSARNVHRAFIHACALLDIDVHWLYGKSSHLCDCILSANDVRETLCKYTQRPDGVYITSPDYLGNIADIKEIAKACEEFGVPLLVDNAHGAYLKFSDPSLHPIDLGAAMCCDSAHKTLPVLTGGAYLHISKKYDRFSENARRFLSLFASTSPSYLIMRSLDICNQYLNESFRHELSECVFKTESTKEKLLSLGFDIKKSEPLKIVIDANSAGYTGDELGEYLRKCNIEPEFCDSEYTVLMTSPKNSGEDHDILISALKNLEKKEPVLKEAVENAHPVQIMGIRKATLAPSKKVKVRNALGKICASICVSCPPAVPIAVCGELIGEKEAMLFEKYGIEHVDIADI